jgi:hypothetical protein
MADKFSLWVRAAEKRVAEMDEIDGIKDRALPTILSALECGLKGIDSENVTAAYDAYVMLREVVKGGVRND